MKGFCQQNSSGTDLGTDLSSIFELCKSRIDMALRDDTKLEQGQHIRKK